MVLIPFDRATICFETTVVICIIPVTFVFTICWMSTGSVDSTDSLPRAFIAKTCQTNHHRQCIVISRGGGQRRAPCFVTLTQHAVGTRPIDARRVEQKLQRSCILSGHAKKKKQHSIRNMSPFYSYTACIVHEDVDLFPAFRQRVWECCNCSSIRHIKLQEETKESELQQSG